jgi:osmotically-inducible protein OsmY
MAVWVFSALNMAPSSAVAVEAYTFTVPSDKAIRRAIQSEFANDPRLRSPIGVQVSKGEVTLMGDVESREERMAAEEVAANTLEVAGVRNLLKIRPKQLVTDEEIAERVRASLSRNAHLDPEEIHVSVVDGTVYLTGIVDSYFERLRAEYSAFPVDGVRYLDNRLVVLSEQGWKRDTELQRKIERELRRDLASDDIRVTAHNGFVILNGTVDTWEELARATDDAFKWGAERVRNNLTVRYNSGAVDQPNQ